MRTHPSAASNQDLDADERETPMEVFGALDTEFGPFTLDAAATPKNRKCADFFSAEQDGAIQSWGKRRVWVNPPYSQIARFTERAIIETGRECPIVVMLLPVRTDTEWFHRDVLRHAEVRFLRKRIRFLRNGVPMGSPPFASMVVIWRNRAQYGVA